MRIIIQNILVTIAFLSIMDTIILILWVTACAVLQYRISRKLKNDIDGAVYAAVIFGCLSFFLGLVVIILLDGRL